MMVQLFLLLSLMFSAVQANIHTEAKSKKIITTSLSTKRLKNIKAPRPTSEPFVVGPCVCEDPEVKQLLHQLLQQCHCNTPAPSSCPCPPIPITQPITINTSGFYCLANDINDSIIINADNVIIDLNNHTITANATAPIIINGGSHRIIYNGKLTDSSVAAIDINNSTNTNFSNIAMLNCTTGLAGTTVTDMYMANSTIEACGQGVVLTGTNNNVTVENFVLYNLSSNGFDTTLGAITGLFLRNGVMEALADTALLLGDVNNMHLQDLSIDEVQGSIALYCVGIAQSCFLNGVTVTNGATIGVAFSSLSNGLFQDCHVFNTINSFMAIGFLVISGQSNQFINCSANDFISGIELVKAPVPAQSAGFFILNGTTTEFIGCSANRIFSGNESAYGFHIEGTTDVSFKECIVQLIAGQGLGTSGFNSSGYAFINTQTVRLENCQVLDPSFEATGYFIDEDSSNIVMDGCLVNHCLREGFLVAGVRNSLTSCQALSCRDGFSLTGTGNAVNYCQSNFNSENGFISTGTQNILGNCSAIQNGTNGYFGVQLYHCFATQNGTDYNTIVGPLNNVTDTDFQAGANLFF